MLVTFVKWLKLYFFTYLNCDVPHLTKLFLSPSQINSIVQVMFVHVTADSLLTGLLCGILNSFSVVSLQLELQFHDNWESLLDKPTSPNELRRAAAAAAAKQREIEWHQVRTQKPLLFRAEASPDTCYQMIWCPTTASIGSSHRRRQEANRRQTPPLAAAAGRVYGDP